MTKIKISVTLGVLFIVLYIVINSVFDFNRHTISYLPDVDKTYTYEYPVTDLTIDLKVEELSGENTGKALYEQIGAGGIYLKGTATFQSGGDLEIEFGGNDELDVLQLVSNHRNEIVLEKPITKGKEWETTSLNANLSASVTETYTVIDVLETFETPVGNVGNVAVIERSYSSQQISTDYFYIAENIGLIKWDNLVNGETEEYKRLIDMTE
ncbi:hypothetical protein HXA34_18430 [Salipaludibacillus agaradhaerens]|uniref:hypothetical protein n=1 Tax=Salipaludibacillus agaradhaerens TaxID=76935 RepID=UPI0021510743|nr:hypothetical protein [Salipaludibacillus agaradhaerens]MCR6108277.1 hypothetical protein [Salipaludibacillus agaradhaerens]MCR6120302.1 hypothetical protein [Salipaludibacillus agaradhaerens]